MSIRRHLTRGLRVLLNRPAADRDIADEVRHYLEQATDEHMARGLSYDDARRAARLECGNATVVAEQVREYGWENALGTLVADLRQALRRLRANRGFTVVAVLTVALGVGASTTIFSAVNPILFELLPYPNARRVVAVWDRMADGNRLAVTFGTYRELIERSRSFEAIAVMRGWEPTISGGAEPERLIGQQVSAGYFHVLGVSPAVGQDFDPSDDRPGGPNVVIISDGLWQRRFGGDRRTVGQPITLGNAPYVLAGVMPRGFENVLEPAAEVWSLLQYDKSLPTQGREWGHHLRMIGLLRPGVAHIVAGRDLDDIAHHPLKEFPRVPWSRLGQGLTVTSLQDDVTREIKPALLAVIGAVVLLLGIACVNVTNLLLARGAQRQGEFAMRAALGAKRSRLIRQLLTESLLLAILGGVFGLFLAELGIRALVALSPAGLPRADAICLDVAVFAFAFGITTLIGLLVGLIPALQASQGNLQPGLEQSSRHTVGRHRKTRSTLVAIEVAFALVLLLGSGLLFRSLQHLLAVPLGFNPSHLLAIQVKVSGPRYASDSNTHQFYAETLEVLRGLPGVTAAAFSSQLPLGGDEGRYGVLFESNKQAPNPGVLDERRIEAHRYTVSPAYSETMGISLRHGRTLNSHDVADALPVAMISESLAHAAFPTEDAIGRRLRIGPSDSPWFTIVGVVADVKQSSLALSEPNGVYLIDKQLRFLVDRTRWIVLRSQSDLEGLAPAVKTAIWSLDKDQPIIRIEMMDALVAASVSERRFVLVLFEVFALVALALAAIGIYGVLSGSVTERMREIGVRSALGASRANILRLILRQGMTLTGCGIALGLAAAFIASQALVSLLFGISRLDPLTYLVVIALLVVVSTIACGVPAWRAARIDPSVTLKR